MISSISSTTPEVRSTSLNPYTGPWTHQQAAHLVRRTHIGLKPVDRNTALIAGSATAAVQQIIDKALNTPLPDEPAWFNQTPEGNILHMYDLQFEWMEQMYNGGLLDRMKLFWSNHFAVSYDNMNGLMENAKAGNAYPQVMYMYAQKLHVHAMGDFRELVRRISKEPAMVYYLNNHNNSGSLPNEDFARELLELFTMSPEDYDGTPNYTEADIQQVARSVTGWWVLRRNNTISTRFDESRHDAGTKTVFGIAGNYNLDGLIDHIFTHRKYQSARFICKKLYCFFVSAEPNQAVINELADYMVGQNFDISATLQKLLSSEHFFSPELYACRIKSPLEWYVGFLREIEMTPSNARKEYIRVQMKDYSNEEIMKPVDVFGWPGYNPPKTDNVPGHFAWINTNLMPVRWQGLSALMNGQGNDLLEYNPVNLVRRISTPSNPLAVARDLAAYILPVDIEEAGIHPVEEDFAGDPAYPPNTVGYTAKEIDLAKILLGELPHYEWGYREPSGGQPYFTRGTQYQIQQFLAYLIQLPAYQLI